MIENLVLVLLTAVLSCALTLGSAWLFYRRKLQPDLERKIEETMGELAQRVGEKVRQGVLDGVASIPSTEVLRGTQRSVVKTAADLIEDGLSALLGKSRRPDGS